MFLIFFSHFQLLQQYVNTHTAAFWATSLVNNLMAIKSKGTRSKNIKLEAKRLAIEYKTAAKRLFFFDYDVPSKKRNEKETGKQ